MTRAALWLALLLTVAVSIWLVGGSQVPLGVPGEWTWGRQTAAGPFWLTLVVAAVAGALYLAFVRLGATRIGTAGRKRRGIWLAGLAIAGFVWLWVVQESASEGYQLSKAALVLYYPGSSGYFTAARSDRRSTTEFLRDYERQMSEGDVLHIGTHPPGLILLFRGLLTVCQGAPRFTDFVVATEPESVRSAMDELGRLSRTTPTPLLRPERAALWLAALLAQMLAALTVLPVYGLLRRTCSPQASWMAAAFWPAVPALAVFLPKSDAAFPCLAALIALLFIAGFQERRAWMSLLAGLALWLALMLSLAFLPVVLLAVLVCVWNVWAAPKSDSRSSILDPRFRAFLWTGLGCALPIVLLRALAGVNMLTVWWWNLTNHAGFYKQFPRTYWKWLLVNPFELVLAAGTPLVIAAACGVLRSWRRDGWRSLGFAGALVVTWGALWISGKNSGEAARLWILLTPFLVCLAGSAFENRASAASGEQSRSPQFWLAAMALQLIVCVATATAVAGFSSFG